MRPSKTVHPVLRSGVPETIPKQGNGVTTDIQTLIDDYEIRRLVIGFSLGLDTRDASLFRSAWADTVELNIGSLAADVLTLRGPRQADDYAREVTALMSGFTATQHLSTNHRVEFTDGQALCTCYTQAEHFLAEGTRERRLSVGSRYDLRAVRFPELGWRFTHFTLTPIWNSGDRTIWAAVAAIAAQRRQQGAAAPDDRDEGATT